MTSDSVNDEDAVVNAGDLSRSRSVGKSLTSEVVAEAAKLAKPVREWVNHPRHYNNSPSGIECIEIAEQFTMNTGNAIKYLWRCGEKHLDVGDPSVQIQDLRKAKWYLLREAARLRANPATGVNFASHGFENVSTLANKICGHMNYFTGRALSNVLSYPNDPIELDYAVGFVDLEVARLEEFRGKASS